MKNYILKENWPKAITLFLHLKMVHSLPSNLNYLLLPEYGKHNMSLKATIIN